LNFEKTAAMASFQKKVTLDDIWPDLDAGLSQLLTDLNEGFPKKRWMKLYTCVWALKQ
jgi:hypothetical protein